IGPLPASAIRWLAAGFVMCLSVGLVAAFASGTTLKGLVTGLVTTPAMISANSFHNPFMEATRRGSLFMSVMGVGVAAVVFGSRRLGLERSVCLGLLKATLGMALLLAFWHNERVALTGSLVFLWLLVLDVPRESPGKYANRLLLALSSVLFSLQIYPVAGSQVNWAALLPITAAGVLYGDGATQLAEHGHGSWCARSSRLLMLGAALCAFCVLWTTAANTAVTWRQWRANQALDLPGAHWLRLPLEDVARLRDTTE